MTMTDQLVCELPKNAREVIRFRLAVFKGHNFVDVRIFSLEDGKEPAPTKKGMALAPHLWPEFKAAMHQVEDALIKEGWLDPEDLKNNREKKGRRGGARRPKGVVGCHLGHWFHD